MSDEDLKFRDECALRVMEIILAARNYEKAIKVLHLDDLSEKSDYTEQINNEYAIKDLTKLARVSYKMADLMRQEKLKAFK